MLIWMILTYLIWPSLSTPGIIITPIRAVHKHPSKVTAPFRFSSTIHTAAAAVDDDETCGSQEPQCQSCVLDFQLTSCLSIGWGRIFQHPLLLHLRYNSKFAGCNRIPRWIVINRTLWTEWQGTTHLCRLTGVNGFGNCRCCLLRGHNSQPHKWHLGCDSPWPEREVNGCDWNGRIINWLKRVECGD